MRHRWRCIALGLACLAGPSAAQRPAVLRVQADNDAFNFWLPPWERSDHEYTSGVRGSLGYDGHLPLIGRLMPRLGVSCGAMAPCATHVFTIGQAIFTGPTGPKSETPAASASPLDADARARPNAGWLYLQASERDSTAARATELSVAVGVVGPQALGETMQRFFHSLAPEFQRPVDWSRQLPFEPGMVVRYTRTDFARPWVDNALWRAIAYTSAGAAVGTIVTEGVLGAGIRTDAWLPGFERKWYVPRVEVSADGRVRGVLRDEFLDGAFFRSSERVERLPVVVEQTISVGFRWRRLALAYRVSHSGRQYKGQEDETSWGTIGAEWRVSR